MNPGADGQPPTGDAAPSVAWRHVEVRGRQVLYGEAGDGPPVLFLHGWGLHPRAYQHALVRLAAVPVHVIAPALPGFGGTAALGGSEWSLAGFGAWVAEFLDAAGITDRPLVMGHSFGGGVAIAFAHDHPDRVRGLVLINSIGASAWARRGVVTSRTMAQRPLWDWGVWFPGDLWPLGQALRVIPAVVGEAAGNLVRDPWSVVKAADLARRADLRRELEELKGRLPVVVLWGTRDRLITRDAFEEMCELLGRPQAVTVEGSHGWLIADPDAFAEVITNVVDIAAGPPLRPRRRFSRLGPVVERIVRRGRADRTSP